MEEHNGNMRMAKRMLQSLGVLGLLGIMYVSGRVQEAGWMPPVVEAAAVKVEGRKIPVVEPSSPQMLHEPVSEETVTILDEILALSSHVQLPEFDRGQAGEDLGAGLVMGEVYPAAAPFLIGIDPGHLGYTYNKYFNTGAVSVYGTVEYEWTMEIARCLSDELTARGYDVYLLRTTNEQKEYPYNNGQRAMAANSMECDILVAIHWDSNEDQEVNGYHTIYRGNKTTAAYRLAKAVSDSYGEAVAGELERFVSPMSRKDLWELNAAEMPSIILECGFASNREDAAWLENEDNYSVIASGIADGIDAYFAGEKQEK